MRSVVDRNVVMRHIPVLPTVSINVNRFLFTSSDILTWKNMGGGGGPEYFVTKTVGPVGDILTWQAGLSRLGGSGGGLQWNRNLRLQQASYSYGHTYRTGSKRTAGETVVPWPCRLGAGTRRWQPCPLKILAIAQTLSAQDRDYGNQHLNHSLLPEKGMKMNKNVYFFPVTVTACCTSKIRINSYLWSF